MTAISKNRGLEIAERIYVRLRKNKKLAKSGAHVAVYAMQNGREHGYIFACMETIRTAQLDPQEHDDKYESRSFSWTVYEHRNSDAIVINGAEGYLHMSGELPYKGDKWDVLASFSYNEYDKAATALARMIMKWHAKVEADRVKNERARTRAALKAAKE